VNGHEDRLAGLVVLSAVLTGIPTVGVRGLLRARLARGAGSAVEVADIPVTGGGAVIAAADAGAAAAQLAALLGAEGAGAPGLVWVLWGGTGAAAVRRAAAAAGLEAVAWYRSVGEPASPTHLVREGRGQALRWYAASARPRWGARSRAARVGNHLPLVGHRFFDGRVVLLRTGGGTPLPWPGADFGGDAARSVGRGPATIAGGPAVLHLGGGATAGRIVLTWADGSGSPTHHTKVAPGHLTRGVVAEAEALGLLAGLRPVSGTVPALLDLRQEPTWAALTASHLPGRPARTARRRPPLAGPRRTRATDTSQVDAVVTAWVTSVARASQGRAAAMASAVRPARGDRLVRAVASLDDVTLQSVVTRGLDLGAESNGLLHGDLWSGNVHLARDGRGATRIAVLDWESALVGHPLVDLLTWLVSRSGRGELVRHRALDVLGGRPHDHRGDWAWAQVRTLLAALGQPCGQPAIEALVLAQMVVVAVDGGPRGGDGGPGGGDDSHERAWLDAVRDVWAAWQGAGGSSSASRLEVSR
jgi:hypothetical protein